MNPQDFQSTATAWITAIGIAAGAAITVVVTLLPKIGALRQAVHDAMQRLDDHSRRITETNRVVTNVALEVEPKKDLTSPTAIDSKL